MAESSQHRPGLSVVMIGRDEAEMLPRTLPPLGRVADELVFVDTGSTDATREIVARHGGRVVERTWDHDFSAAKNFGVDQARHQWILNVDCDERLVVKPDTQALLAGALASGSVPAYLVWIDNLQPGGGMHPQQAIRLFLNDPRIRFSNPVHESVGASLVEHWPRVRPVEIDLRLRHYGYGAGTNREKLERNITILRGWTEREPDDAYAAYKLGTSLCHAGDEAAGLASLDRAFDLLDASGARGTFPFIAGFLVFYRETLERTGRVDRLRQVDAAVRRWSPPGDPI